MDIELIMQHIGKIAECSFIAGRAEGARENELNPDERMMFRELSLQEMKTLKEIRGKIRDMLKVGK